MSAVENSSEWKPKMKKKNKTKTFMVHVRYTESSYGTKKIQAKNEAEAIDIAEQTDFSEFDCDGGGPCEDLEVTDVTEIK